MYVTGRTAGSPIALAVGVLVAGAAPCWAQDATDAVTASNGIVRAYDRAHRAVLQATAALYGVERLLAGGAGTYSGGRFGVVLEKALSGIHLAMELVDMLAEALGEKARRVLTKVALGLGIAAKVAEWLRATWGESGGTGFGESGIGAVIARLGR